MIIKSKKILNLLQDKLEQTTKMQNLLHNGLEQISKIQNFSQNRSDHKNVELIAKWTGANRKNEIHQKLQKYVKGRVINGSFKVY